MNPFVLIYSLSAIASLTVLLLPRTFIRRFFSTVEETLYIRIAFLASVVPIINSIVAVEGLYLFIRILFSDFRGTMDYIRREFGFTDSFGLRHSIEDLSEVKRHIHKLHLDAQASYADVVTRENVNNEEWLLQVLDIEQLGANDEPCIDFIHWNATSVGNLAYIAKYSSWDFASGKAKWMLNQYKEYMENFE